MTDTNPATEAAARYVIRVDANGSPVGVLDVDRIYERGTVLAYELAAAAGNGEAMAKAVADALDDNPGDDVRALLMTSAAEAMCREIVEPLLATTDRLYDSGHLVRSERADLHARARLARELR